MALPVNTKPFEVTFAVNFIKYIGGNSTNLYLLLAIIAWLRSESGTHYIGNNPLNIRNSPYANGFRRIRGNGHFATFANLAIAAKASAAFLMNNHGNGYELMLASARRAAQTDAERQRQAIDFLTNLALSKWDSGHYGMMFITGPPDDRHRELDTRPGAIYKTTIYKVWVGLTGHKVTLPVDPKPTPKPPPLPKPHARPSQPYQGGGNPFPQPDYLQPYAASQFYERRVHAESENPGGG